MSANIFEVAENSVRGTFFLTSGNILAIVIHAVTSLIVARLLGAELYGVYTVSLVVPSLLLMLTSLGINQGLTRFSSRLRVKGDARVQTTLMKMLRVGLLLQTLLGIIIFSISFVFSDYLATYIIARPDYAFYVRLASISLLFQVLFNTAGAVFVGFDRTEYYALSHTVNAIVKALVSPLLILLGFSVIGAITGFAVGHLIAGIIAASLLLIKLYKPLTLGKTGEDEWRGTLVTLLRYSFPLYIATLLLGLTNQLTTIILAYFTSDVEIGNFRASFNFIILLTMIALPLRTTLFPAFSKLESQKEKAKTFFLKSVKFTSLLLIPLATFALIFSSDIVRIVYGETFTTASLFLSLQAFVFLLVGLGSVVQESFFNGLGETRLTLNTNVVNFMFFILLAPFLTQAYKVVGLIFSLIIGRLSATSYGLYLTHHRFKASIDYRASARIMLVAAISAIPAFLIIHLLPNHAFVSFLLGGISYLFTYVSLVPIAGAISKFELDDIQQITRNIPFLSYVANIVVRYERKMLAITGRFGTHA